MFQNEAWNVKCQLKSPIANDWAFYTNIRVCFKMKFTEDFI